jgi:hypothetical protein
MTNTRWLCVLVTLLLMCGQLSAKGGSFSCACCSAPLRFVVIFKSDKWRGRKSMRYLAALLGFIAWIAFLTTAALARGGPLHLYGPFSKPTISKAAALTRVPLSSDLLSGCGRGRYRDTGTHKCRGPAGVQR